MIRILFHTVTAILVVAALVALPGCGGPQPQAKKTPAAQSRHYEGDGHDHSKDKTGHSEGDGHDHSKDKGNHSGHDHDHKK